VTSARRRGMPGGGTTALRIQLGAHLRRLRKSRHVTRESAGWEIRASESKISRIELGRVAIKERDIADLLTLYGVAGEERIALLSLARQASRPAWWQRFADVMPPWFQSYLGLEDAASLIRSYEVQFVPGLLQTADYARAVIELGHAGASAAEIDRRIQLRQSRQQVFGRDEPPQLWAVIDEAVLRRPIGSSDVMRAQLEALIEASRRPHIHLQIVSAGAVDRAAACAPFAILRFAEPEQPDVVYVEQPTDALYLDNRGDVDDYAIAMAYICTIASPPDQTATIVGKILDEIGAVGS
jgi:transcriptional regulator with XRE-family HTH domain